jgi:hypothetical protein
MPNKRFRHHGRRQGDVVRSAIGWFAHGMLMIMIAFWISVLTGVGIAHIVAVACIQHKTESKVCTAVKQGLVVAP